MCEGKAFFSYTSMNFTSPIPLGRKKFQTIIGFYLFECPVRTFQIKNKDIPGITVEDPHPKYTYDFSRVSRRGLTFRERGLDGPVLNSLRAAMKRAAPGIILSGVTDDPVIPDADEYIIIRKNEKNCSITEGYFYCVRNGFAHGSFNIEGRYYSFENRTIKNKLNGIARLKENTLIEWIRLCGMSASELKEYRKQ